MLAGVEKAEKHDKRTRPAAPKRIPGNLPSLLCLKYTYAMIKLAKIIWEAIDPKSFSYVSKSQQTEVYELLLLLAIDASRGTATAISPPP